MTPERYQQVCQLYHTASELRPDERAAFLDGVCGSDQELRGEVSSMLRAHKRAGNYFAAPALEVAAGLLASKTTPSRTGQSLNHYQMLSLLGAGGMGEVWLAEDTHLSRKVAVKLLPTEFIADADRVRRFAQEAHAVSALNHPNIITIHEIGQAAAPAGGAHYIVTEYVAGATLRQRLASAPHGRIEPAEAIDIAVQIAAALSAAHEAGIMHRDIKPENVMVRPDGLVKVLDFGLAKLTAWPVAEPEAGFDSEAPTVAKLSTEPGVVMGTVSYMSPEQARGLKVDHRTDIFSLGVLLYEMVAGRRPFEGATTSDVIATLLTAEPRPLRQHCAQTHSELERITEKCLASEFHSAVEIGERAFIIAFTSARQAAIDPRPRELWIEFDGFVVVADHAVKIAE